METTTYKSIKALIQCFSVFILAINLGLIIYSFYQYFLWEIEKECMERYFLTYFDSAVPILFLNMLITLFANCGITSCQKFYIRLFKFLSYMYFLVTGILTV